MTVTAQKDKAGRLAVKIPAQHPAFFGHFPDNPLLPGVVVLDKLIQQLQAHYSATAGSAYGCYSRFCLESVKFLHSVGPDDEISFHWEEQGAKLRFHIYCQTIRVAQGTLTPHTPQPSEQAAT